MKKVDDSKVPYVGSFILREGRPFGSRTKFQFDRRANVLIGPNGVAKALL